VILPTSVFAQEASGAILRSNGVGVLVNKSAAPASIALFSNDLIETLQGAVTRIESTGSTAEINPETMVQFEGDELVLDHGSLSVNTTRGLRVRVGCVTVAPVNTGNWTHYEVVDRDGKVTVSSTKSDVYIDAKASNVQNAKQSSKSERTIVRETEQKSRDERCGATAARPAVVGAGPVALSSPWAIGTGAAAVGAIICLGICHGDDPVSPSRP
jgi:hypothetical protein